ncbi:MAG: hypothetical protein IPM51_10180 [Sphingobacteriaceae bacterium]|nr:hypothetical protein [Sphingobacteriaceae bacterium]
MKFFLYGLIWASQIYFLQAQSNAVIKRRAEDAMREKDWYAAAQHYSRLFNRDSSELTVKYNYAEVSRLNFDLDLALRLYKKVVLFDDDKKLPLAYYWIGHLYKYQGNYKEAKKWFVKFSKIKFKKKKGNYDYYVKKAKLEVEACDLAQIWMKNPVLPKIEHLDTAINSKVSEYAAFEMDSTLYFSSLRNSSKKDVNEINYNKIYFSEMKNEKWQRVKTLDTNINATLAHNANTAFNQDYTEMIVSRCVAKNGSEYTCELFSSANENGKWNALEKMKAPVNLNNASTTQPCYGKLNGKTVLFFSSNRPGGQGGLDIWYAIKNPDGLFSTPVNCGTLINTPDDEITPWFVEERKTLYFSSTYHKGLGGFDIFKSLYNDTIFGEPENLGYPINSSYNDIYYSVNKARNRAYVSSNRVGSFFENKLNCCNDIYRFNIEPLTEPPKPIDSTKITREKMKLLVPLTLYFHNDEPNPKTKLTSTTKNYESTYNEYKVLLPQYLKEYSYGQIGVDKEDCLDRVNDFFTDSVDAGMEDLKKFAELTKQVLLKGQTVKITMKGYCSPLASTDYNVNLAKRRISSLRNYFIEYENGWFKTYIDNQEEGRGKIVFEDVDIGELAASRVSDDLKDKRNSVYSPFAARERKIQIIAVGFDE